MKTKQFIWETMEHGAVEKFYIEHENKERAKKPAFIICSGVWTNGKGNWELYMNKVCSLGNFKTKDGCIEKIEEIAEKAVVPIKIWKQKKDKFEIFFKSEKFKKRVN